MAVASLGAFLVALVALYLPAGIVLAPILTTVGLAMGIVGVFRRTRGSTLPWVAMSLNLVGAFWFTMLMLDTLRLLR
jgi:hypothetical protein